MNQTDKVLYTAAVHTTGGREGPRLRRHCCKTSLAKPRALAAWCMESQPSARRPGRAGDHFRSRGVNRKLQEALCQLQNPPRRL
jgi:hypothetical protein